MILVTMNYAFHLCLDYHNNKLKENWRQWVGRWRELFNTTYTSIIKVYFFWQSASCWASRINSYQVSYLKSSFPFDFVLCFPLNTTIQGKQSRKEGKAEQENLILIILSPLFFPFFTVFVSAADRYIFIWKTVNFFINFSLSHTHTLNCLQTK